MLEACSTEIDQPRTGASPLCWWTQTRRCSSMLSIATSLTSPLLELSSRMLACSSGLILLELLSPIVEELVTI